MGDYVASQVVKLRIKKGITVNGSSLLMLGITFKENCPDVRNTKIVDVVRALEDYGIRVTVYDMWANPEEVRHEYGITSLQEIPDQQFDAVVLGVAHHEFSQLDFKWLRKDICVLYDVKGILEGVDRRL